MPKPAFDLPCGEYMVDQLFDAVTTDLIDEKQKVLLSNWKPAEIGVLNSEQEW